MKSILKPYDQPPSVQPDNQQTQCGFNLSADDCRSSPEMLRSLMQQLASETRSARLDAYLSLGGALKAHDGAPPLEDLADFIGPLMQFIRRDLTAEVADTSAIDTPLATQAIKLAIALLWFPQVSRKMNSDFCTYLVDHAIRSIENPNIPKALTNHYMHFLGQQKFSSQVMTMARATRLLNTLDGSADSVRGNSAAAERLLIYQRLLAQAPSVMASNPVLWVDHLFVGMLSSVAGVRSRAINFGTDAALTLGIQKAVSSTVSDVFNRDFEGGTFAAYLADRLQKMALDKVDSHHVPRIWTVVILFLRSKHHQLERWEHMKCWLEIMEKCFNSSDIQLKFQANLAWNRFVLAVNPDEDTDRNMIQTLHRPISGQLKRRAQGKTSKETRKFALSSLCNLLYYSMPPMSSYSRLDLYWQEYVSRVFRSFLGSSAQEANQGCYVLAAMFDGSQTKSWDINRAIDLNLVRPEEISRLDPRWVRSRTNTIIQVIELALSRAPWIIASAVEPPVKQLWTNFIGTLADAGVKEIKVSSDLMEAIASLFNMLQRIWERGPDALGKPSENPEEDFVRRFTFLCNTMLNGLGTISFTEKVLSQDFEGHYESVATTSASRKLKNYAVPPTSPIILLFRLFSKPPFPLTPSETYYAAVRSLLDRCLFSRSSMNFSKELLADCAGVLDTPPDADSPIVSIELGNVLTSLAREHTIDWTLMPHTAPNNTDDGSIHLETDQGLSRESEALAVEVTDHEPHTPLSPNREIFLDAPSSPISITFSGRAVEDDDFGASESIPEVQIEALAVSMASAEEMENLKPSVTTIDPRELHCDGSQSDHDLVSTAQPSAVCKDTAVIGPDARPELDTIAISGGAFGLADVTSTEFRTQTSLDISENMKTSLESKAVISTDSNQTADSEMLTTNDPELLQHRTESNTQESFARDTETPTRSRKRKRRVPLGSAEISSKRMKHEVPPRTDLDDAVQKHTNVDAAPLVPIAAASDISLRAISPPNAPSNEAPSASAVQSDLSLRSTRATIITPPKQLGLDFSSAHILSKRTRGKRNHLGMAPHKGLDLTESVQSPLEKHHQGSQEDMTSSHTESSAGVHSFPVDGKSAHRSQAAPTDPSSSRSKKKRSSIPSDDRAKPNESLEHEGMAEAQGEEHLPELMSTRSQRRRSSRLSGALSMTVFENDASYDTDKSMPAQLQKSSEDEPKTNVPPRRIESSPVLRKKRGRPKRKALDVEERERSLEPGASEVEQPDEGFQHKPRDGDHHMVNADIDVEESEKAQMTESVQSVASNKAIGDRSQAKKDKKAVERPSRTPLIADLTRILGDFRKARLDEQDIREMQSVVSDLFIALQEARDD